MHSLIDVTHIIRKYLKKAGVEFFNDESHFEGFDIRFDIHGRSAGQAGYKSQFGERHYYMRFNQEAIKLDWEQFSKETIPHEVAHIVCYMRPELGHKHNSGWRRVCIDLGGTGDRCHTMQLTPGRRRRTKKFMYTATCGTEIELSSVRHNKIRRGHSYTLRASGGKLNNSCVFKQVA